MLILSMALWLRGCETTSTHEVYLCLHAPPSSWGLHLYASQLADSPCLHIILLTLVQERLNRLNCLNCTGATRNTPPGKKKQDRGCNGLDSTLWMRHATRDMCRSLACTM